jgi:hypothetical protein
MSVGRVEERGRYPDPTLIKAIGRSTQQSFMTEIAEKPRTDLGPVESPWAVTERGKRIHKTEDEVKASLRLLVLNGGEVRRTAKQLRDEGLPVKEQTLGWWRDRSFPRLYMQLRKELGREVSEKIAGNALERALEADTAEKTYIAEAIAKVQEVSPDHLAKNALALANAKATNIEKAQVLRHEPSQIIEVDVNASIEVLERLGVVDKTIDAEVIGEE